MICPRCQTSNAEGAVYCAGCRWPLPKRTGSRKGPLSPFLFMAAGAAALIVLYVLYRLIAPATQAHTARGVETARSKQPAKATESSLLPNLGEVILYGTADREIFRTTSAIFRGGRLALPLAALFGGKELTFQADRSEPVRIMAGTWALGDPVVFWIVDSGNPSALLDLAEWRPSLPLDWHAVRAPGPPLRVEVTSPRRAGSFACFPKPTEVRLPGVFVQEGAVVGWTFGDPFDQAYLWSGAPSAGPPPDIRADHFFSAISSNYREGYFRRLLESGGGTNPSAELEALAKGFRLAPLLAPEDILPNHRQAAVVARMDSIASGLITSGRADEVIRILDDQTIRESLDPVLARDAVLALAESRDYNKTLRRLETIERDIFAVRGLAPAELGELKSRLYKDWLRKIIEKGDYYSGAVAFEEASRAFPDDPEVRLLGVEIAIADNDPVRAREIFKSRDYPPALKEWADRLKAQLFDPQEEAGEMTIQFDPGKGHIPVEAVINGSFRQKFMVDTGASFVCIPSATAEALKIKLDDSNPARAVATADGVTFAYEVTLESIRLDKFTVENIKALVVDMPLNPEYGLLGLNFLDAFSVEIDKQKGILKLKKRPT